MMMWTRPSLRLGESAILHRSDATGTVSAMGEHLKWDVLVQTDLATEEQTYLGTMV
jgi:hypothetical protein